ncbi:MAG: DUF6049 family protein [Blastococcus sp.]
MIRTAAGRAGGRPAAHGPASRRARARTRARILLIAMALAVLAPGVLAPAALAAPATPASLPSARSLPVLASAPGDDDASSTDRPVTIRVGRFEPRTVTPGATITVTGTLTNTGPKPITDLGVRLQRGEVRTTREELGAALRAADPATSVVPAFKNIPGSLAPGGSLPFSYSVPSAALQLDTDGVYPVLLNVNGTVGGNQVRRVGELASFVVREPVAPKAHTTVAWLWPLAERSHRGPTGGFLDDGLTQSISADGRLDRLLATLERLPRTLPSGATEPVPALPVTLAVDPALVEELTIMAAGPYAVHGVAGAGKGTAAAAAFLVRLRALAAVHPVVALSYGDVDADALDVAGLPGVLSRSLPGTAEGTAQDPPGGAPAPTPTTPAAGTTSSAGPQNPGTPPEGAGARILAAALHTQPRTDLYWAAGGSLRPHTITDLQAGGVRELVLGSAGLTDGDRAVGLRGGRAAARTTVATPTGPLDVLVADPALGDIVGAAEKAAGGPRMAEQRYLAELAVLGLQAPAGTDQTVLVAPPRTVDAGPEGAGAMMADAAGLTWLRPGSLAGLAASAPVPAGKPADPADAVRLDPTGLAELARGVAVRDDLAGAVVGDAGTAMAAYDAAIARTASAQWRGDPAGFRTAARTMRTTLERLRGRVTLLSPANGTYSLASSDAPLVLTVRNDLPFAVSVRLDLRTRGNRGLSISDIGPRTLAPGQRTTLQVPTHVQQSGGFAVIAALTTPSGGPLGDRVEMKVKSTAYGSISLLITFGAAGLLALLFLRRLILFVLRRRRSTAQPEEPTVVLPPTRSPV